MDGEDFNINSFLPFLSFPPSSSSFPLLPDETEGRLPLLLSFCRFAVTGMMDDPAELNNSSPSSPPCQSQSGLLLHRQNKEYIPSALLHNAARSRGTRSLRATILKVHTHTQFPSRACVRSRQHVNNAHVIGSARGLFFGFFVCCFFFFCRADKMRCRPAKRVCFDAHLLSKVYLLVCFPSGGHGREGPFALQLAPRNGRALGDSCACWAL